LKAIILVGGEGLRLRPLTCNVPKPMVPVLNRPFLEHTIGSLKSHGVDEVILAICYLPDRIRQHFGDGSRFGVKMTYAVEDKPLGTGGAIKNAEDMLDGTFVVLNGDIYTDLDLTEMVGFHRENKAKATIALTPVDDPTSYGVVELNGDKHVRGFVEKPGWERVTSNLINAGTYVLEPEVLDLIPADAFHMVERGLFPSLVERGDTFLAYASNAYWIDIGVPDDYLRLHHDILMGKARARFPGKSVADDVWVDEGTRIDDSARLAGPVVVGRDCEIEKDAHVEGPAVIGDGCTIGAGSLVEQAVIWQGVRLGNDVKVRKSVVGNNSVVGDGTWVSDGAIVADEAVVGSGNRLEHGIKVWPRSRIEDGAISF